MYNLTINLSLLLFLISILVLNLNTKNIFINILGSLCAIYFNFIFSFVPSFLVFIEGGSDPGEGSGSQIDSNNNSGSGSKTPQNQSNAQSHNETNPPKSGFDVTVWKWNFFLSMLRLDTDYSIKNKLRWWKVIYSGSKSPNSEEGNSSNQDSNDSAGGGE